MTRFYVFRFVDRCGLVSAYQLVRFLDVPEFGITVSQHIGPGSCGMRPDGLTHICRHGMLKLVASLLLVEMPFVTMPLFLVASGY